MEGCLRIPNFSMSEQPWWPVTQAVSPLILAAALAISLMQGSFAATAAAGVKLPSEELTGRCPSPAFASSQRCYLSNVCVAPAARRKVLTCILLQANKI